jgi:hypothetical protein
MGSDKSVAQTFKTYQSVFKATKKNPELWIGAERKGILMLALNCKMKLPYTNSLFA